MDKEDMKFKVGDNVRIVKNVGNGIYDKYVGTITYVKEIFNVGDDVYYTLPIEGGTEWSEEELELVQSISSEKHYNKYWEILEECARVAKEREPIHGDSLKNHKEIADMYAEIHGEAATQASDVAEMMVAMKLARIKAKPDHWDSYIDLINYVAILMHARQHKE